MHNLKKPQADLILRIKTSCIARKGIAGKSSKPMVDPNSLALLSLRGLAVECISMSSHRPAVYTPVPHYVIHARLTQAYFTHYLM